MAVLPQLVRFPTATIPALLGKRLSRAASGFTFLGAVGTYCLFRQQQEEEEGQGSSSINNTYRNGNDGFGVLRRGIGLGAMLHISLVWAKIIGLDGGGFLLPGRGLWQDYPSLVKASGAATSLMMITYSMVVYATAKAVVK